MWQKYKVINHPSISSYLTKKQSKNMQEAKMLDIDTEIKIFEKTSGIDKENIKVGDKNE